MAELLLPGLSRPFDLIILLFSSGVILNYRTCGGLQPSRRDQEEEFLVAEAYTGLILLGA